MMMTEEPEVPIDEIVMAMEWETTENDLNR
jgi:hypothetical protein